MIRKIGRKWALVTSRAVFLHDTKAQAQAQETAIQLAQARRAGHRIPRLPRRKRAH